MWRIVSWSFRSKRQLPPKPLPGRAEARIHLLRSILRSTVQQTKFRRSHSGAPAHCLFSAQECPMSKINSLTQWLTCCQNICRLERDAPNLWCGPHEFILSNSLEVFEQSVMMSFFGGQSLRFSVSRCSSCVIQPPRHHKARGRDLFALFVDANSFEISITSLWIGSQNSRELLNYADSKSFFPRVFIMADGSFAESTVYTVWRFDRFCFDLASPEDIFPDFVWLVECLTNGRAAMIHAQTFREN